MSARRAGPLLSGQRTAGAGPRSAVVRLYAELNDLLPPGWRQRPVTYRFSGTPAVKDAIEALGVPHTEVELILVDGRSVGFDHRLSGGERVAVYPVFERFDVTPLLRVRRRPLREVRFVCDVHLGKLARRLRMLGLDTVWRNDLEDAEIAGLAQRERRIVLTRDRGLLKRNRIERGCLVRGERVRDQLSEVVRRLDLAGRLRPLTRCPLCNGAVEPVPRDAVLDLVPPRVRREQEEFRRCAGCGKIYWAGSHVDRFRRELADLLDGGGDGRDRA